MRSLLWVVLLLTALAESGCGAGSKSLKNEARELETRVAQLRARSRADRLRIRDLENDVLAARSLADSPGGTTDEMIAARGYATPSSKGRKVEAEAQDDAFVPKNLPVETVFNSSAEAEVVGYDENGAEILYAGDALRAGSYRPRVDKYDLSASRTGNNAGSFSENAAFYQDEEPGKQNTPVIEVRGKNSSRGIPKVSSVIKGAPNGDVAGKKSNGPDLKLSVTDDDERSAYREAFDLLQKGDNTAARAAFRDFLQKHPKGEYSDNAQYWLGEAYYDVKQFRSALVEFHRVVDKYPNGNKVPDALLKISFCHLALGEQEPARAFLQNLIKYHPSSNSAVIADGKLQALRK